MSSNMQHVDFSAEESVNAEDDCKKAISSPGDIPEMTRQPEMESTAKTITVPSQDEDSSKEDPSVPRKRKRSESPPSSQLWKVTMPMQIWVVGTNGDSLSVKPDIGSYRAPLSIQGRRRWRAISHQELLIVIERPSIRAGRCQSSGAVDCDRGAQNPSKEIAVDRAQRGRLAVLISFEFARRIRRSSHSAQ